ncbi:hypothetical protein BC830DRAFT_1090632 [Chytriomyces sp. MP71]|nr:hypothetical protein BC830DRAFT_1090632 [Chytriomyces sp. MP71]
MRRQSISQNVSLCISDFLAIERYLISHNMLEEHTKKFFVWWGLFKLFLAVAGIVSLALEAFNSSGHLRDRVTDLNTIPDFDTVPFTIWATCLAVSAAISVITTIMLYWRSCVAVVEKFQNSSLSHTVDRIILILERNVLKNALIMSSTVIICYFPLALVTLLVILDVEVPIWVGYVVLFLVGMDTLAVPFQIIYFMPNVRTELKRFLRWNGGKRRNSVALA